MKCKIILLCILTLVTLVFYSSASATVTQSTPSPSDDATDVDIHVGSFTILLNTSLSANTKMNGTIICVVPSLSENVVNATNGTQTLTLPTLSYSTKYQIWVNISDVNVSSGWKNTSYNFTTETAPSIRLSDNVDDPTLIIIAGLLSLMIILWAVVLVWNVFKDTKKVNAQSIKDQLIILIVLGVIVTIILSFL